MVRKDQNQICFLIPMECSSTRILICTWHIVETIEFSFFKVDNIMQQQRQAMEPGLITFNWSTDVMLDADENLFISDNNNHRIIKLGPFGFQPLFGCTNTTGSAPNQLSHWHSLSFDSCGNLYVADRGNNRTQKFLLVTNSCGKLLRSFSENSSFDFHCSSFL